MQFQDCNGSQRSFGTPTAPPGFMVFDRGIISSKPAPGADATQRWRRCEILFRYFCVAELRTRAAVSCSASCGNPSPLLDCRAPVEWKETVVPPSEDLEGYQPAHPSGKTDREVCSWRRASQAGPPPLTGRWSVDFRVPRDPPDRTSTGPLNQCYIPPNEIRSGDEVPDIRDAVVA